LAWASHSRSRQTRRPRRAFLRWPGEAPTRGRGPSVRKPRSWRSPLRRAPPPGSGQGDARPATRRNAATRRRGRVARPLPCRTAPGKDLSQPSLSRETSRPPRLRASGPAKAASRNLRPLQLPANAASNPRRSDLDEAPGALGPQVRPSQPRPRHRKSLPHPTPGNRAEADVAAETGDPVGGIQIVPPPKSHPNRLETQDSETRDRKAQTSSG